MIEDICKFQKQVLLVDKPAIGELTASEALFVDTALIEEYKEWQLSVKSGNIVDQVDALLDLTYFAIGAIYKLGLDANKIQTCFDHIHATNMTKVIGKKVGREGFSSTKDAVLSSKTHEDLSKVLQQIIEEDNDEHKKIR